MKLVLLVAASAFVPLVTPPARVRLADAKEEPEKPRITWQGLSELVTMGLGAPNLGKFKGVDKDTGTLQFELESNRFIGKDGKEYNSLDNSKGTYFEYGYVDESKDVMKQLANFFGGNKKDDDADNKR